jgi:ubiquinone/menaquinone biosynthesis C-methylase UbiE
MSWYERNVMDRIIERVLGASRVEEARRQVLEQVRGDVLEIGLGTGLNLNAYPPAVRALTAVTREQDLHPLATRRAAERAISIRHLQGSAEQLPCADRSFDTVVCTFLFCSLSAADAAARECARVLRPEGRLLFLEHVAAPTRVKRTAQKILDLPSRAVLCGCSLVRDTPEILRGAGFQLEALECFELRSLPWTHSYVARGLARPPALDAN